MTHFIFMWKNLFTENLVHLIICKLIKIHELLMKIIINKYQRKDNSRPKPLGTKITKEPAIISSFLSN